MLQLAHQSRMAPCGKNSDHHSGADKCGPEPKRRPVRLGRRTVLDDLELLQEKSEARHNKTESHQGKPSAHPRQKRSLSGKIVAQGSRLLIARWAIHFATLRENVDKFPGPTRVLSSYVSSGGEIPQWQYFLGGLSVPNADRHSVHFGSS